MNHEYNEKASTASDKDVAPTYVNNNQHGEVEQLYDPSKESIWTRMGISFESYKRAPGATGSVLLARGACLAPRGQLPRPALATPALAHFELASLT